MSAEKPWTWELANDSKHANVNSVTFEYNRETNAFDFTAATKKVTKAWFYCTINAQAIDLMVEAGYTTLIVGAAAPDKDDITIDYVGKTGNAPEITAAPVSLDLLAIQKAIKGQKKWYFTFCYTANTETEAMNFSVKFELKKGA